MMSPMKHSCKKQENFLVAVVKVLMGWRTALYQLTAELKPLQ